MSDISLRLGSCLDPTTGLPSLARGSVDHTITDPPYEGQVHSEGRRIRTGGFQSEQAGTRDIVVKPISYPPMTEDERTRVSAHIARVTKRWILIFCQVEAAHLWRAALEAGGAEYVRTGSWHKSDAQPQYSGDRPGQGWEAVVIAHGARAAGGAAAELPLLASAGLVDPQHAGRMRWNGGGYCATWRQPSEELRRLARLEALLAAGKTKAALKEVRRLKACEDALLNQGRNATWRLASRDTGGNLRSKKMLDGQKPEELMRTLVRLFTDPGELICDPYAGAGTTLLAAGLEERRALGWEIAEPHHALAHGRLQHRLGAAALGAP